jgi:hypothetical protein
MLPAGHMFEITGIGHVCALVIRPVEMLIVVIHHVFDFHRGSEGPNVYTYWHKSDFFCLSCDMFFLK